MSEERGPFYPEIVGPFLPEHFVTINGYKVPYVTVTPTSDGRIEVYVDRRFGLDAPVSIEEFNRWIGLLADAMAVAAGYSSHGENCSPVNPHKVKMGALGRTMPILGVIEGGNQTAPRSSASPSPPA